MSRKHILALIKLNYVTVLLLIICCRDSAFKLIAIWSLNRPYGSQTRRSCCWDIWKNNISRSQSCWNIKLAVIPSDKGPVIVLWQLIWQHLVQGAIHHLTELQYPCRKGKPLAYTKAVWKVHGLATMRRCYAEGSGDCYAKLLWWGVT
jgi:hypothetical protein